MSLPVVNTPEKNLFTIEEVCEIVDVQAHVLRYWETEFPMLSPQKNRAGQRSYRMLDVEIAFRIKELLYDDFYTVEGAKNKLIAELASTNTIRLKFLKNLYKMRQKIGAGGMGEVYLAHDESLDREVAVKVLLPEFCSNAERVNRFKLEARAASALNHPNIITIFEIGMCDEELYIATENIKGETLRSLIERDAISFGSALHIAEQILSGLNAAHAAGIIHRDLKPENIMVREDGIVKILDFGLAKPTSVESEAETRELVSTKAGMVMGSVSYMSPEQSRGKETDARTDLWSVGIVLYEMLTGKTPFEGETVTDTLANIIHKEPVKITEIIEDAPPELHRILKKSLRKDREDRYQSATDFLLDLKNLRREKNLPDEILKFEVKSDIEIIELVNLQLPETQQEILHELLERNSEGDLTELEKKYLDDLMEVYNDALLTKATATRIAVERGLMKPLSAE